MVEDRIQAAIDHDRSRLRRLFLDELRSTFEARRTIDVAWLRALLNASPTYLRARDLTAGFVSVEDNSDRIRRLIIRLLELMAESERGNLIEAVVPEILDLSVLCDVFRAVAGDTRSDSPMQEPVSAASFGNRTDALRLKLLERVKEFASSGTIWDQAVPRDIMWFWWGSTEGNETSVFSSAVTDPKGLRALLDMCVHTVYSSDGNYETVSPTWSKVLDLTFLENTAREFMSSSNADDKEKAERFLTALGNRGRHGRF